MQIKILALLFVLSFSTQIFGQQTNLIIATQEQLAESVKIAPCKSEERLEAVKNLFIKLGAKKEDVTIEKFDGDKIANVVVKIKGKTAETIVVGAHYDKTKDGCGAIDNWTGISIIAHLYQTLSQMQTSKSFVFVAFDKEEHGLFGSAAMTKAIGKENRSQYCSMINFDSFGFAAPQALENASSPKLIKIAKELAKESDFPFAQAALFTADADSTSFKQRGIPAITLHGLSDKWQNYLHSKNDQLKEINFASVYYGYRFGLGLIVKLDKTLCLNAEK